MIVGFLAAKFGENVANTGYICSQTVCYSAQTDTEMSSRP
jgi:hypothetical protein